MSRKIHEGLKHVSSSGSTLSLLMDDGEAVHLGGAELQRLLDELAYANPGLLHIALEHRLVKLVAAEVLEQWPER
jgi:hypothetical protein